MNRSDEDYDTKVQIDGMDEGYEDGEGEHPDDEDMGEEVLSDEEEEYGEVDENEPVSARPRRMSEISIKNTTKPIPKGTSFFLFSQTSR